MLDFGKTKEIRNLNYLINKDLLYTEKCKIVINREEFNRSIYNNGKRFYFNSEHIVTENSEYVDLREILIGETFLPQDKKYLEEIISSMELKIKKNVQRDRRILDEGANII